MHPTTPPTQEEIAKEIAKTYQQYLKYQQANKRLRK
jgi:hypothetical protein